MFLTQTEADNLTHKECENLLKDLAKKYNLNEPLAEEKPEFWTYVDDIVDTILYLEDRMRYLEQSLMAQNANATRYGRELKDLI